MPQDTIKAIYDLQDNMSGDMKRIIKEMDRFDKEAKSNNESLKKLGSTVTSAGMKLAGTVAGVTAGAFAFSKLVSVGKESVELFKEQDKANRLVKASLGESYQEMRDFADQLQITTNIGDESTLMYAGLLKNMGLTTEATKEALVAANDLVAGSGGMLTMDMAVKNLGKTYAGTAGRLTEFIPELKGLTVEQLKNGEAVRLVAERYKGLAEELADSPLGRIEAMNNEIGDLKEEIGEQLIPIQKELTEVQRDFFAQIIENKSNITAMADTLVGLAGVAGDVLITLSDPRWNIFTAIGQARNIDNARESWDKTGETLKTVIDEMFKLDGLQKQVIRDGKVAVKARDEQLKVVEKLIGKEDELSLSSFGYYEINKKGLADLIKLQQQRQNEQARSEQAKIDAEEEKKIREGVALAIHRQAEAERVLNSIRFEGFDKAKEHWGKRVAEREKLAKEEMDSYLEAQEKATIRDLEMVKRRAEAYKELAEEHKQQTVQSIEDMNTYANAVSDIVSSVTTLRIANINAQEKREIKAIQNSTMAEEEKAGAIKKIEADALAEKKKTMLADWARSIAMIQVNTMAGMAKTWANVGYPGAIPLTIALGAQSTVATAVAMANKPKFQDGGIVAGTSMTGDQVEARLNSGEMVLNKQQQTELFNIANGGTTTNNSSFAPVISVSAVSSEGVEDAVLNALYSAYQNNKVDDTILSIGAV